MNVRKVQAAAEAAELCIAKLAEALQEAKGSRDLFAVHVYQARTHYKMAGEHYQKGGRKLKISAQMSYRKALTLGYSGTEYEWKRILEASGEPSDLDKTGLENLEG